MAKMYVHSAPSGQLQLAEELQIKDMGIGRFLLSFVQLYSQGNGMLGLHSYTINNQLFFQL